MIWQIQHERFLDLAGGGVIMGILNVTPDSFSDGGRHLEPDAAVARGLEMWRAGARILDVGGESTRPGAAEVPEDEELRRVLPVIAGLRSALPDAVLSIDTMKAEVARRALDAGADVINDVTGLRGDPRMAVLAAERGCGVVVMHMQGMPRTMQNAPRYGDVVAEVRAFFLERAAELTASGLDPRQMVYDPGIGFGKNLEHNLLLLGALESLAPPDRPLLLGVSRKSFIAGVLENPDPTLRDWPTVGLTSLAREAGARILRVHDVAPNFQALRMTEAILDCYGRGA